MSDRNEDVIAISERIDRYLAEHRGTVWPVVQAQITTALDLDPAKVAPASNLVRDLGATSLDYLDLTYRLEMAFEIKIPRGPIQYLIQSGLDEQIDPDGRLSPHALERLRIVMPEVDAGAIQPGLKAHQISDLYTAETFVRLASMALSESDVPTSVAR
jgi:acyl carrier protein